ncbi:hypothetical protein [Acinetobacter sp. YH12211]|uniref:hypothetical protein n=1 Tax=Acinetobacter sp. YH12211 TaxID=2601147 RepID=UPI0015D36EE2|nr:hypothetical protein [Acinetobacter sp. YH12211]
MPQGLQCFDSKGYSSLSITDRITKVIGVFVETLTTRTKTLVIVDKAFLSGLEPFVHCHMGNNITSAINVEPFSCLFLDYSLSGDTLTINFGYTTDIAFNNSTRYPFRFIVGVY